jgi:hypothetical protein
MLSTASAIVAVFTVSLSLANTWTISLVHPSVSKHALTAIVPHTINGRLRPYRAFERSDITPTIGCMIRPDNGPAIQTSEILLFVKPSARRYGVQ